MGEETPENQSEEKEIEEIEEWEIVEETTSQEEDVTAKPSTKTSTSPPQTVITKPKKDRNKCPKCGSEIVFYFQEQDFYWCQSCHEIYQFEEED